MPKITDMASTGLRRYARLANKPRQKYGLFAKLSLAVIGACEVVQFTHISITISNQHNQESNIHFYGTLNHYGPMVFASDQEQNEYYTFKDMLLQLENSYFILATIKQVGAHEAISHGTLMKNSEVKNKHKNKYGKLKTILSIWSFK